MKIELSQAFIDKTKNEVTPHFGELGWVTYKRTYARWIEKENRTENWDETVKRVVEGNINLDPRLHHDKVPVYVYTELNKEAQDLFRLIYGLASTPSGRNLWISGTEYQKKHGDALNNCYYMSVDPKPYGNSHIVPYYLNKKTPAVSMPFAFLFDELMKGGGVGASVYEEKTKLIPSVDRKVKCLVLIGKESSSYNECIKLGAIDKDKWLDSNHTNKVLFTSAEDSREGWVKSMALLIDAHFLYTGKHIEEAVIDLTNIRGKGEKINGFGGVASGPMPLVESLFKVNEIINNKAGSKLTSVDCTDICNLIGKCVVSGGVRRSAEIVIGDADDSDFITMKQDKEKLMDHRWASNNSVIVDHNFTDYNEIATSVAHNGEPGIIKLDLSRNYGRMADGFQEGIDGKVSGFNPCFGGDIFLLTTDGFKKFRDLDGKLVNIINKDGNVVPSKVWCSGEKNTIEVKTSVKNNTFVVTPDHKFMANDGSTVEAKDLKGKRLMPNLNTDTDFNENFIVYGFAQGDGDLGRLGSDAHKGIEINVEKKDKEFIELLRNNYEFTEGGRKLYVSGIKNELINLKFDPDKLPNREFPLTFDYWTYKDKKSFLRGCYSANGSVLKTAGGRITYKTTCKKFSEQLKKALKLYFNIDAYITVNKKRKNKFYNGVYKMKESYDVNIGSYNNKEKFYNHIGFVQSYKMNKLKKCLIDLGPIVTSIIKNKVQKVYDFVEPEKHWGIVSANGENGFIAHNCGEISLEPGEPCNLFEVFPLVAEEQGWDLADVFKLATRYAKRVTFSKYDWEISREVIYRNRRIGVSISGIQDWVLKKFGTHLVTGFEPSYDLETRETYQSPVYNKDAVEAFDGFYHDVINADNVYSNELGCKPSIKHTTVKPSGTVSKLAGVSEGMHFHYGAYLIQRIRFQDTDPILDALKACGYHIEKDAYSDNTMCVEFPVKAANSDSKEFKSSGDVSIEEQFATQAFLQTYWADNAVSCTITFHKNEENKIAPLFRQYRDITKSTSLLPYSGSGYVQAPKEPISKEKYLELKAKIHGNVQEVFDKLNNEKKDQEIVGQQDCESGMCPLK